MNTVHSPYIYSEYPADKGKNQRALENIASKSPLLLIPVSLQVSPRLIVFINSIKSSCVVKCRVIFLSRKGLIFDSGQ